MRTQALANNHTGHARKQDKKITDSYVDENSFAPSKHICD